MKKLDIATEDGTYDFGYDTDFIMHALTHDIQEETKKNILVYLEWLLVNRTKEQISGYDGPETVL